MKYILSEKYKQFENKIMGPNPIKLTEELMLDSKLKSGETVLDLGSGQGLTSVFLAKEYGYKVYAADLWSDPKENQKFFDEAKATVVAVKADANSLPFEKEYFDGMVCIDSYNYFGRDKSFLDEKLLPYIKSGGYIYLAIAGMVKDCHDNLPPELLLSWNEEQLEYMHDLDYWKDIVSASVDSEIVEAKVMESNDEVWADWLRQDNEYAIGDRKSMEAGGGKYLNFIKIVLRKK